MDPHFTFNNFFWKILSFIRQKNAEEPVRPQTKIRRMRTACWTPKATKTHSEYVIIAFSLQQWLHEGDSM